MRCSIPLMRDVAASSMSATGGSPARTDATGNAVFSLRMLPFRRSSRVDCSVHQSDRACLVSLSHPSQRCPAKPLPRAEGRIIVIIDTLSPPDGRGQYVQRMTACNAQ